MPRTNTSYFKILHWARSTSEKEEGNVLLPSSCTQYALRSQQSSNNITLVNIVVHHYF